MTVDVEDYFQVQAFADHIPRSSWDSIPRRVEANIEAVLDLFETSQTTGTFFILGWIAERHPQMIRRIASAGHELASHGYDHKRADCLPPVAFREDIHRSKRVLEDIAALPVTGYRAPTFSIGRANQWAYELLEGEGYTYSSSTYPIRHDLYGDTAAPRQPFRPGSGRLWELPLTTRRLWGQNLPVAGGGYFRLLPYNLWRRNLVHLNRSNDAAIFYFHPWELDPQQPRVPGINMRTRVRHYTNLQAMPDRLKQLLRDFRWRRMDQVFADLMDTSEASGHYLAPETTM